jgi:hypothetical protein
MARSGVWSTAVVSDAEYALKATKREVREPSTSRMAVTRTTVPASVPQVTAVCQAYVSGELFLGFHRGEVFCFQPEYAAVTRLPLRGQELTVRSLAVSERGQIVVALRVGSQEKAYVSSLCGTIRDYYLEPTTLLPSRGSAWLCPTVLKGPEPFVWLCDGSELQPLRSGRLLPEPGLTVPDEIDGVLLFPARRGREGSSSFQTLVVAGGRVRSYPNGFDLQRASVQVLGWRPTVPAPCHLSVPPLSWFWRGREKLELAGVDQAGRVCLSRLEFEKGELQRVMNRFSAAGTRYRAVTFLHDGLLIAVTDTTVELLRYGPSGLEPSDSKDVGPTNAVACFPGSTGLLIVASDGAGLHVSSLPGRPVARQA